MSNKCTVIIIQAGDVESNHIRLTNIPYEPNSTSYQFKSFIHEILKTPKYKTSLCNEVSYYSHIGIINDSLSPHDIFQIDDNDILMDCISPNDTVYIYNPSINTDTVLIQEYIQFFNQQQNNDLYDNIDTKCELAETETSQSYRKMSISEDIDINIIDNENDQKKQTFFNAINLYFAYCGAKYGNDCGANNSNNLVQISHSILIWALRKMDNLWKRKDVQDKLTEYLKAYCFEEEVIIDTIIFGNKLTDENAMNLITYTPWMACEPSFSVETYAKLSELKQEHSEEISSEQAYAPIINEQITILNCNKSEESQQSQSVDHPYFHQNEHKNDDYNIAIDPDSPIPHQEKYKDDSLDNTFNEIKRNKDMIENGPKRWPAREGTLLYLCQFVFGLCNYEKFEKYMYDFGKNIGLNENTIKYIILIWESENDLAKSLWNFAELEFPLIH